MCIELRGYRSSDIGVWKEGLFSQHQAELSTAGLTTLWNSGDNVWQHFTHLQRTTKSGLFSVVTPHRAPILLAGLYAHGGDFPTSIRTIASDISEFRDRGKRPRVTAQLQGSRNVGSIDNSGRLHVDIGLDEGLLWGSRARSHDHSPCARREDKSATGTCPDVSGGTLCLDTRVSPKLVTSDNGTGVNGSCDLKERLTACTAFDVSCGWSCSSPVDSYEADAGLTTSTGDDGKATLIAFLRTVCWNFGQLHKGLWDERHKWVCGTVNVDGEHPEVWSSIDRDSAENLIASEATWSVATEAGGRWVPEALERRTEHSAKIRGEWWSRSSSAVCASAAIVLLLLLLGKCASVNRLSRRQTFGKDYDSRHMHENVARGTGPSLSVRDAQSQSSESSADLQIADNGHTAGTFALVGIDHRACMRMLLSKDNSPPFSRETSPRDTSKAEDHGDEHGEFSLIFRALSASYVGHGETRIGRAGGVQGMRRDPDHVVLTRPG